MKKILIFFTVLSTIIFTGCTKIIPSRHEISEIGLISCFGIDKGEKDPDNICVTVSTKRFSQEGGESQKVSLIIYKSEAKTLSEAIKKLDILVEKPLTLGHVRTILISEEVAKDGILKIVDYFLREPSFRYTINVLVIKGQPVYDVIKVICDKNLDTSKYIEILLDNTYKMGYSQNIHLLDFVLMLNDEKKCEYLPCIRMQQVHYSKDDRTQDLILDGYALFKDHSLYDYITYDMARAFTWYNGKSQKGLVCIEGNGGNTVLEVVGVKTEKKVNWKEKKPVIDINVKITSNILEHMSTENFYDSKCIKQFEEKQRLIVKKQFEDLFTYVQDNNIDILGIGDLLYHKYQDKWEEIKDDWKEIFKDVKFNVTVESRIVNSYFLEQPVITKEGD